MGAKDGTGLHTGGVFGAALFTGEHQHTLDAKGRVILPARFRDRLASGLYVAPGQDRCVDVYPVGVFEKRVEQLRSLPREHGGARGYLRVFLAGAQQETPDGQGRVTLPPRLREYAGLERDLTVVGSDDKIEIWDRETWEAYRAAAEEAFATLDVPFDFGTGR